MKIDYLIQRYSNKTNVLEVVKITMSFINSLKKNKTTYNVQNKTLSELIKSRKIATHHSVSNTSKKHSESFDSLKEDIMSIMSRKNEYTATELYIFFLLLTNRSLDNIPINNTIYRTERSSVEKVNDNVLVIKNECVYKTNTKRALILDIMTEKIVNQAFNSRKKICAGKAQGIVTKLHNLRVERRDIKNQIYPQPINAEGSRDTFVGRIRPDYENKGAFNMWVVSDNLLKGAAWNTVENAEYLVKMGLI